MHKKEGILAVVNAIGNYVRMPMSEATADQMMKVLQVSGELLSPFHIYCICSETL